MPTPRPARRGPYRTGVRTRARVVESAIAEFGRLGYRGATVQAIAAAADVSPGGVIKLFGSKEMLLRAAVDAWDRQTAATLFSEDVEGLDYLRRLPRLLGLHAAHREMIELQARLLVEATDPEHPAHDQVRRRYDEVRGLFAAQIVTAGRSGDVEPMGPGAAEAMAGVLIAVMDGIQQQWLLDPGIDMPALMNHYLDTWLPTAEADALD